MKNLLYIIFIFTLQTTIFADNNDKVKATIKNVTGKIISVQGEEIAGATLLIKETNQTFFADLEGNFQLELATDKAYSISIQTLGYAPIEVKSTELSNFAELILKEL